MTGVVRGTVSVQYGGRTVLIIAALQLPLAVEGIGVSVPLVGTGAPDTQFMPVPQRGKATQPPKCRRAL